MEKVWKERETHRMSGWTEKLFPLLVTFFLFAVLPVCFRPVFILNDDMLIDSILSGTYWEPYPYTYYFSAPLGLLISGLYCFIPRVSWLGLFYILCIMVSFWCVLNRLMRSAASWKGKALVTGIALVGFGALYMPYVFFLHYTLIAGILGATGVFLLGTAKNRRELPAPIFFLLLSYLVRENVFFMVLPFAGICALFLVIKGEKERFQEYLPYAGAFLGLFLVLFLWNRSILLDPRWAHYKQYNDARTQIYDYLGIPLDEEAMAHYAGLGLTPEMLEVYLTYDLALEKGNSGESQLNEMIAFVKEREGDSGIFDRLYRALAGYKHRLLHWGEDKPYMVLTVCLYGIALLLSEGIPDYIICFLLFAYRSAFWVYLLYGGRYPQRVTYSLFLMEIGALLAFIYVLGRKKEKEKYRLYGKRILLAITVTALLATAVFQLIEIPGQMRQSERVRRSDETLYSYFREHQENTYYLDVYATIRRCRYALTGESREKENYIVLGGWILEHPLYRLRLGEYDSMAQAMAEDKTAMFVKKEGIGIDITLIEKLTGRRLQEAERLDTEDGTFLIYDLLLEDE